MPARARLSSSKIGGPMASRVTRTDIRRYSSVGPLLGAVILSIGLCGLAYSVGSRSRSDSEPAVSRAFIPEFSVVEVPVPERPVPAGTLLREVKVRRERYPEHQLPSGALRDLERVRDGVVLAALPAGLPILQENIGTQDEATNPILGHIPPGMRAMTVRVDATAAVEGWVRGGSVVDVLLVEKAKTSVVAEKVKVISAERSLSPVEAAGSAAIPSTVTLLVTQEQCLAINTAVPLGKIAFALRSNRDAEGWRDTHFSPEDLPSAHDAEPSMSIEGVVSVGEGRQAQRFALVNGAWLPAHDIPKGFLLANRAR